MTSPTPNGSITAINEEGENTLNMDESPARMRLSPSQIRKDADESMDLVQAYEGDPTASFTILTKIIAKGLRQQFEDAKIQQMIHVSDATPQWNMGQFVKSLIYHNLVMVFLGPMSLIILICFENITFLKNSAFWPNKATGMFFMM